MGKLVDARNSLSRLPWPQLLLGSYLLVVGGLVLRFHSEIRHPSETKWGARVAEGKLPGFLDYMHVGLYWGGLLHLVVIGFLLLSAPLWMRWSRAEPVRVPLGKTPGLGTAVPMKWFWACLIVLVVLAAPARLVRMDHSFWGDEAWAVERFVHGRFIASEDGLDGELKFRAPTWAQTFFDDRGGGSNHQLQTLAGRLIDHGWRGVAGVPRHEVLEWPFRLPSLFTGLAALVVVALLLRRLGYPIAGLAAAAILAVHPWHVRYSSEGRGYGPMLCLLFASMWALVGALRRGRWRDWLLFAALELLTAYAWKGAPFALLVLNAVAALAVVTTARRTGAGRTNALSSLSRLVVVNLVIAGLFLHLNAPNHLQISDYWDRTTFLKGWSFSPVWVKEFLSHLVTGAELFDRYTIMPVPLSLESAWNGRPWVASVVATASAVTVLAGAIYGCRTSLWATLLSAAPAIAVGLGLAYFWVIRDSGLLVYYTFYGLAGVICLAGLGVEGLAAGWHWCWRRGQATPASPSRHAPRGAVVATLLVVAYAVAVAPVNAMIAKRQRESLRDAWELTRGQHEGTDYKRPSNVRTIYHWRHARIYDPRAMTGLRDADSVRVAISDARADGAELYIVIGNLMHMEHHHQDVMDLVRQPEEFEPLAELWAYHPVTSLLVYRMRHGSDEPDVEPDREPAARG